MTPTELREARQALRLTQTQAARLLGYAAKQRISELESGTRHPSETVLRLLRAYLDGYRPNDWPQKGSE